MTYPLFTLMVEDSFNFRKIFNQFIDALMEQNPSIDSIGKYYFYTVRVFFTLTMEIYHNELKFLCKEICHDKCRPRLLAI